MTILRLLLGWKGAMLGGSCAFGLYLVDCADASPLLDDIEIWRNARSCFYEIYFVTSRFFGKRFYIEEPYWVDFPRGTYLRCAVDSLEKAHQILGFDYDERLRRKVLRKAQRYVEKAVNANDKWTEHAHKWYGLILLKRAKYGNRESRLTKAVSELEKAIATDIEDARVWEYLGIALQGLDNNEFAMHCYRMAAEAHKGSCPQFPYHRGSIQMVVDGDKLTAKSCEYFAEALNGHCSSVSDMVIRRTALERLNECSKLTGYDLTF